jgi:hypothetical protein
MIDDLLAVNRYENDLFTFIRAFCTNRSIKAILFDMDFTLIGSADVVVEGIEMTCKDVDFPIATREHTRARTNFSLPRETLERYACKLCGPSRQRQFVREYYTAIENLHPSLYPGIDVLIPFFRSKALLLGIVPRKRDVFVRRYWILLICVVIFSQLFVTMILFNTNQIHLVFCSLRRSLALTLRLRLCRG